MKSILALAALATLALPVQAADSTNQLDLFYLPQAEIAASSPRVPGGEDKGSGFGLRGLFGLKDGLGVFGDYQSASYDDSDLDLAQIHAGVGFMSESASGTFIEYTKFTLKTGGVSTDLDGLGLRARLSGEAIESLRIEGGIAYMALEDDAEGYDALETSLGAAYTFSESLGVVAEYRRTSLKSDRSLVNLTLRDFRAGLRISF